MNLSFSQYKQPLLWKEELLPYICIGVSFGIAKAVSSNGRIRGNTRRRRFESYSYSSFSLNSERTRDKYLYFYGYMNTFVKGGIKHGGSKLERF